MLSRPHKVMLYSLGQCYRQLNKRFDNAPLEVSISKVTFIATLLASRLLGKTERAMYKNLEFLERKKLISYNSKELRFTERGYKQFLRLRDDVAPFIQHEQFWATHLPENRKLQAKLKR
ncbi:MAG TPA: hypothetical protein VJB66_00315 [Candidatus Nanoarchaeia archaeon]|nr:hypothetical protein [Candidatus Nanoarchaeia archaeon]